MEIRRDGRIVAFVLAAVAVLWMFQHWSQPPAVTPGARVSAALDRPALIPPPVVAGPSRSATAEPLAVETAVPDRIPLPRPLDELWRTPPAKPAFARFHAWAAQYQAADAAAREGLVAEGVARATERRVEMKELIEAAPQRALELAVPLAVRRELPAEVTALLEERVSARGDFEVLAALPLTGGDAAASADFRPLQRRVVIGDRRLEASVYGLRLGEPTQLGVPLHGVALDGKIALSESPYRPLEAIEQAEQRAQLAAAGAPDPICSISAEPASVRGIEVAVDDGESVAWFCAPAHAGVAAQKARASGGSQGNFELLADGNLKPLSTRTEGIKRLLLIRVDFSDEAGAPLTDTQATNLIDGLNQFYAENSYGKAGFRPLGTAGSMVTATLRMANTAASYGLLDPSILRKDARNAAQAAGVALSSFNYDLLCFRRVPGFNFGGLGFVGAAGAWIQNAFDSPGVSAHELGHNFGLNHANFWDTAGESVLGAGSSVEYGDSFDTMGTAGAGKRHFNARYKALLDWLPTTYVRVLTTNGTYRLFPMDVTNANSEVRALRLAKNSQTNYWFEFRQIYSNSPSLMNGLGVRWARSGIQSSLLLDTTPGSVDGSKDSATLIGHTFSDRALGLHVTPIGFGGTTPQSLNVVVNRGSFTNNQPPTVDVTASAASGAVNATLTFTAAAADADGDPLAYGWDFGDATIGPNIATAAHAFTAAGEYVVRCEVSDMKGGVTSDYVVVRIGSPSTLRISGTVTEAGRPLEGVRISTSNTKQTFSGADGTYVLTGLARGTYTLSARREGILFARQGFSNPLNLTASRTGADFLGSDPGGLQTVTLVPMGAEWRYWDKGTLPGATWTAASFDDSAWRQGAAQLGYGDDDVVTKVDFGPNSASKYTTTWFRSAFTVDRPADFINATVGLIRDDGAVVYLNGKEIFRSNMPGGTIAVSTKASATVSNTDESTIFEYDLDPAKLLEGRNVLAVELHQITADSSDLSFSLRLLGQLRPSPVAPNLALKSADGVLRISWPVTASGFVLFSAAALGGPWEPVSESVLSSSGEQAVTIAPDVEARWFRLEKP